MATNSAPAGRRGSSGGSALQVSQAKDFRGGLNTFDTPLNLSSRFCTELRNLYPTTNGDLRLRFGTSFFADFTSESDLTGEHIVNMEYYNTSIVVVFSNGDIYTVDGDGVYTARWNAVIASGLGRGPWSGGLTHANFTQFGGQLVVCNGVDKPLLMLEDYSVDYLFDLGTASNVNVPRAKFCTTHNNYLILAVTPTDDTVLYIGMRGTSGTFVGDPGTDNDAVNFETSTYVEYGIPRITGLVGFRDRLIVCAAESILSIALGEYNSDGEHVPRVDDAIRNHGAVSQRCITALGDDALFLDQAGMASMQRAVLTGTLTPIRESSLIAFDMQQALARFTTTQLDRYVFSVHDRTSQHILFFIPKTTDVTTDTTVDNDVFVFCFDRSQRFRAWTYFDVLPFRCACRTIEDRVFLGAGLIIQRYHSLYEPLYTDNSVPGVQPWDTGQMWDDDTGWADTSALVGDPIQHSFAIPWTDLRQPAKLKYSKFLRVVAEGAGQFTVQMFVDNFSAPELQMDFVQQDTPAASSGGLRPNNNKQLYAWPQKFESMKLRIEGVSGSRLVYVALVVMYQAGTVRR